MTAQPSTAPAHRRRVAVRGVVQGVGFRPFVFSLATELGLAGHVTNTGDGVLAEVEGPPDAVDAFCRRIATDAPPLAHVAAVDHESTAPTGAPGFVITASQHGGQGRTLIPPDTATCDACLAEMADPGNRRYRHPFITCTNCGPRFTIVTALPYDRPATTMAGFPLCADCTAEYTNPADRRFHAQPVSCHTCGPTLALVEPHGPSAPEASGAEDWRNPPPTLPAPTAPAPTAVGEAALTRARRLLAEGAVLAVKGIGGYHLACDAENPAAVRLLRRRKNRGDKPFALMARDLDTVAGLAHVDAAETDALTGPARPIVLLHRRGDAPPLDAVAPNSPDIGVMLPYTPLHHLLLGLPGDSTGPRLLVMTSANLSGEPIVTDDTDALDRLARLVDAWLTHDRPIHVPCEDSVVRVVDGAAQMLRRSRGWTPLPLELPVPVEPVLAMGGDLKNAFALARDNHVWLSGHIGDMDDLRTLAAADHARAHLQAITGVIPDRVVADRHPGYRSTRHARRRHPDRPLHLVQHHHAHIAAAMAEHGLDGHHPVVGVAFDGTGYGDDGAMWGGEVLLADYDRHRRFAHLAYVPQPGADAAVSFPYRMALAHLHSADLPWDADLACVRACPADERAIVARQLNRRLNCVPTSSMGRLFDAVSSLAGICHHATYEAQPAIELEAAAVAHLTRNLPAHARLEPGRLLGTDDGTYAFGIHPPGAPDDPHRADPAPVLAGIVADLRAGHAPGLIAVRFHAAVADLVHRLCRLARDGHGLDTVVLTGGVFANTLLARDSAARLRADAFTVLQHQRVPPNDGGLSLGQLMVAARSTAPH